MKVAIYARVSTSDQDCGAQLTELRTWCQRFDYEIVKQYVDTGFSGAKARRRRLTPCYRTPASAGLRRCWSTN